MTSSRTFTITVLVLSFVTLAGCGSGDGRERIPVSGTVTYQGQPVANGEIRFQPIEGTKTSPSGATIKDGQYKVTARGGLPVGKFCVVITAFRPEARQALKKQKGGIGDDGKLLLQFLPPKYNNKSELTISINLEEEAKTANFDLK